jgi:hypothetical protein
MNKLDQKLFDFIMGEMDDGVLFEDILEDFDIEPADVFVLLFNQGLLNPEQLSAYIMDFDS